MNIRHSTGLMLGTIAMVLATLVQASEPLRIALIPAEDSRAMIRQSRQLMTALEQKLGVEVEGFVATDYNGVIESLRAGHVDVAYLGPFSYVKAAQVANVEAFAVAETKDKGGVAYHSQIVVRADSDIQSVEQLRGRDFAFVGPTSTSGYVFPMVGLKKAGLNPRNDFRNVIYTGAHDANLLAVKHGRVDAATVADRILSAAVEKGQIDKADLRVIWRSGAIPESPMVWRKDLPETTKQQLRDAFLSIRDVQFGDQGQVSEYRATDDSAYDIVREAARLARK
ncbi:phosphonate ABC transporter substrate-binding protein [Microbulbifer sp. ALW1]|uniref:phosphonate ABC transporter substrate-binding protein n=1 Tax=Microbulbifer sp. (strain ALW1) TaxID=1516059 RepID=UPI0019137F4E|nr:phosphonate ABC transporter substrate-binding protein [Microbulbifer sp. ALW1]